MSEARIIKLQENSSSEDEGVLIELSSHPSQSALHSRKRDDPVEPVEIKKRGYRERKGPARPRSEKQLQVLKETHRKNAEKRLETKRKLEEYDQLLKKKADEEALSDRVSQQIVNTMQNSIKLDEDKVVDKLIGKLSDLASLKNTALSIESKSLSPPLQDIRNVTLVDKQTHQNEKIKRLLKNRF